MITAGWSGSKEYAIPKQRPDVPSLTIRGLGHPNLRAAAAHSNSFDCARTQIRTPCTKHQTPTLQTTRSHINRPSTFCLLPSTNSRPWSRLQEDRMARKASSGTSRPQSTERHRAKTASLISRKRYGKIRWYNRGSRSWTLSKKR